MDNAIIDFGFGNGHAMDFFEMNGFKVEGVDISSHAVKEQEKKGREV